MNKRQFAQKVRQLDYTCTTSYSGKTKTMYIIGQHSESVLLYILGLGEMNFKVIAQL